MRLLIISRDSFLTDAGKLCQYATASHQVTLVTTISPDVTLPEARSLATHATSANGRFLARFGRWLSFCCSEVNDSTDLVYMYYFPGCSLVRLMHRDKTFVLDIRTAAVIGGPLNRYLRDRLLRLEASCFQHITIVSEGLRNRLRLSRAHVVPVGGDLLDLPAKKLDELRLLYIGSTSKERRIEDTILAFGRAYKELCGVLSLHYTIVGDSGDGHLTYLRKIVADNGLQHVIALPGYVPHNKLPFYLQRCNIGISYVPRTPFFEHQTPTKTFEYLLAGLPVIATATAANAMLVNECNGLLIADTREDLYRGICYFASNPRKFDSDLIRTSVANYSWSGIMRNCVLPYIQETAAEASRSRLSARSGVSSETGI